MGAAQGTVEYDRAAFAKAYGPPDSGHGTTERFIFTEEPLCGRFSFLFHKRLPDFLILQTPKV